MQTQTASTRGLRRAVGRGAGISWALALAATLSSGTAAAGNEKGGAPAAPPPVAEPDVRLRLVAPSAQGYWTMRIENHGADPVRIPADARLLRLEVRPLVKGEWQRQARICDGRAAYGLTSEFPVERELFLKPGEQYVETFDPRLFCFGPDAPALAGGTLVKATFGWDPAPKWARGEREPYAVDGVKYPRQMTPQKSLDAPTMLLSYFPPEAPPEPPPCGPRGPGHAHAHGRPPAADAPPCRGGQPGDAKKAPPAPTEPAAGAPPGPATATPAGVGSGDAAKRDPARKPAPVADELAPRLELRATEYADGNWPRDVVVTVTAVNRGQRELWTALRNRQISFDVRGPDGPRACPQKLETAAIARDWFHRLAPDQKGTLALLAAEVCPPETFERPGLYEVAPTLHPDDAAREHGMHAYLEDAKVDKPTLVRIRHGRKPYHKGPPVAQPLPDAPRPGVYDPEPEPASSPLPSGAP